MKTYNYDTDAIRAFEDANMTAIWETDAIENERGENICEGCYHCAFPGIRWPASPDGYSDLSYVDRCDYCERYDGDESAAKFLAEKLDVRWGYAYREADPKTDEDIRWEPAEEDGLRYDGWSCFIDRPERDG